MARPFSRHRVLQAQLEGSRRRLADLDRHGAGPAERRAVEQRILDLETQLAEFIS